MRMRPVLTVLCLVSSLASCSREAPPEEAGVVPADTAAVETVPVATPDTAQVVRPAAASPMRGPSSFPHEPHLNADVACRTCHASVPGHGTHSSVACRQCHQAPGGGSGRILTRTECLACHHGAKQTVTCTVCHNPLPGQLTVQSELKLSVWPAARMRSFTFPHSKHAALGCRTCHEEPPLLTPTRTCGSCHDRHHRPAADCSTCHQEPPPTAHDVRAHVSCSGRGCHAAELVRTIPRTRPVCLVCHRDRVDHEPGQECATCHQVEAGS